MLHVLLPAAALLTHNSAAQVETKTKTSGNLAVAQATEVAMPTNPSWSPITDGSTHP